MIPSIQFDFNFDWILVMIFISYIIYGYFSGGHKQIRISINLILPFLIIYYLGKYITAYVYKPLSSTFLYEVIDIYFDIFKNTLGMFIAYVITYTALFILIFVFSIYMRRHVLNENMRAKLGVKNYYLGSLVALVNGYVLIYFLLLPVFSTGIIDGNAHITNFVLENPPPFSRIARTAEKAVPIKGLAEKADEFQQLLSVEGIEEYYNEAIYEYQQLYLGTNNSYEEQFMNDVYEHLSPDAKVAIEEAYEEYFDGEILSMNHYIGISRVLVEDVGGEKLLYEELLEFESDFQIELNDNEKIYNDFLKAQEQYEIDFENYEYYMDYKNYEDALEDYLAYAKLYLQNKIQASLAEEEFTDVFTEQRPRFNREMPENYVEVKVIPSYPVETQEIMDAYDFVNMYEDKETISEQLGLLGNNFKNHKGLLMWYVDELDREMASASNGGNISNTIVSFKDYYSVIIENINDEELEEKLYLAKMSITSYDVFTLWIECAENNYETIPIEDVSLEVNRCNNLDTDSIVDYDFTNDALDLVSTLFEGESVSWIIVQYKYDYEAGIFDEPFSDFPEVSDVLDSTKGLVDDYDLYYKDIATSIDGNISMVIKIAISVMKYNLDIYESLEETPVLSAMTNDFVRMCTNEVQSPLNIDVYVCKKTDGTGGFKELFNMQYLSSEILFKAYIMVDDNNELIIYDSDKMIEFLQDVNTSVENDVFTQEVISIYGDQLAFNVIDESNDYTLLEKMYDEGQISIEAMRILADDEYELFSIEFRQRVRSIIR